MTKKIYSELLKETIYYEKLPNGLEIFFMPKAGFTKRYAVFSTNYGSNDLEFVSPHKKERIRVNEGIAHFLEHKMFEQPDGSNAFDKFAEFGANANAYTNFNTTAYLFSSTENFYEGLEHLISYVQTPHFTKENVEKEKGIIAQEIKMYEDNPDWRVFFNTLKGLYVNHPNRIDIAGTVESIYKITEDELYDCYNTFYSPSNMAIFIVGDLEYNSVMDVILKTVKDDNAFEGELERIFPVEPKEVAKKEIEEKMAVSIPMFSIGFKDNENDLKGRELLKKEIVTEMLLNLLFKKGTVLYEDLYSKNLINENFGSDFTMNKGYGYTMISGETRDFETVKGKIFEAIKNANEKGLPFEDFDRIKKKKIGGFIKYFDSIEFIANNFLSYHFMGINFLDYVDVIKEVTLEDVNERLKNHLREEYAVVSLVVPK